LSSLLIIEDNENLATGLRNNLEIEGHAVRIAHDGVTGLGLARSSAPDLIVLDLMLPALDGYRVLETLRSEGNDTPVLILSAKGEEADKVMGFQLGADDYVAKPFGLLELLARVEALLRRAPAATRGNGSAPAPASPPVTGVFRIGLVEVDFGTHAVRRAGRTVQLRPKEYDLLVALIARRGRLVSRAELLHDVWGYSGEVHSRTVDTHIAELRRKLEENPAEPRHILTVRKAGYRLES
jgi:DNA-binding response OmpR family regulator